MRLIVRVNAFLVIRGIIDDIVIAIIIVVVGDKMQNNGPLAQW